MNAPSIVMDTVTLSNIASSYNRYTILTGAFSIEQRHYNLPYLIPIAIL